MNDKRAVWQRRGTARMPGREHQTETPSPAQATAEAVFRLAAAGQHGQAIELASAALTSGSQSPVAQQLRLLALRTESLLALLELQSAEADAQAMLALADRSRVAAHRALALATLAHVQTRQERYALALATAGAALQAARRSRQSELLALALLHLASAGLQRQPQQAAAQADEAARRFAALGDLARQGQALRVLAAVKMAQTDSPEHRAIAERAVALARASGDRGGEARAINSLYSSDPDLAQRVRGLQQALRVAVEGGDRQQEAAALHNLALTYNQLGLRRRALRLMQQSLQLRHAQARPIALLNPYTILAILHESLNQKVAYEQVVARARAAAALATAEDAGPQLAMAAAMLEARGARWLAPAQAVAGCSRPLDASQILIP